MLCQSVLLPFTTENHTFHASVFYTEKITYFVSQYFAPAKDTFHAFSEKIAKNLLSLKAKHNLVTTKIALTWAGTAAPTIRGERTMLPIRVVAETLGAEVLWDADSNAVTIILA